MDSWGWDELQPWLELRLQLPVGPLLCVITVRHAVGSGRAPPHERTCCNAGWHFSLWRALASA
jgi:hypothetical protein